MKRILSISLLTLVLLASSRMTVSAHYCAGELVSLEFFKTNKGCGKCGSTKKKHACCKDVNNSITSENFNSRTIDFEFAQSIIALPAVCFSLDFKSPIIIEQNRNFVQGNAPPNITREPRYILFSSLIV